MRRIAPIATALCIPFNALAGPREEARAVMEKFLNGFTANSVETLTGLLANDALFRGTVSREAISTPAGVQRYFVNAFTRPPGKGAKASAAGPAAITVISDEVAVVSGAWKLETMMDGKPATLENRVGLTVAKRGDLWLIVSFHISRRPPPA